MCPQFRVDRPHLLGQFADAMKKPITKWMIALLAWAGISNAPADVPGGRDPEGLKRYENSELIAYREPKVDEFNLPLGRPTKIGDVPEYEKSEALVGRVSRYCYLAPEGVTAAALFLNYKSELEALGLDTLYTKKPGEKGWFGATFNKQSAEDKLSQMLAYNEAEERVLVAKTKDESPTYYYLFVTAYKDGLRGIHDKKVQKGAALAYLQVISPEKIQQKMVFVDAAKMATELASQGRVALYGLYFDTAKDTLRDDSLPTLGEISKLLKDNPELKVRIVGHTDNEGKPDYNLDLSRRRAASVVKALTGSHGIAGARLDSFGCGLYAPVASNDTAEGKAKNRRVELVKQ